MARGAGRIAGLDPALHAFRLLDADARIDVERADGADVAAGDTIARITARRARGAGGRAHGAQPARPPERDRHRDARRGRRDSQGLPTRVVCTRKTTPGLRALEKHAVRAGGGSNHRFGLDDAVLVKDNHVALAGGDRARPCGACAQASATWSRSRSRSTRSSSSTRRSRSASTPCCSTTWTSPTLREAVRRARGRALTEASGGIRPENVRQVAETGVDLVSIGWLTHSAPSLDVALDVEA